jgi:Adenylate and Guanylate cyclase catalytic domain
MYLCFAHTCIDDSDAENPLSTPKSQSRIRRQANSSGRGEIDESDDQLGHYETEQLINAIAKIADLLRKCWGVAGAGIISSNLARTKDGRTVVFNPTIPGKQVYALFGFVGINDFGKQLRSLEGDVMILINDVARVVHDEVYRWALGDSGQCNKNLGGAFLMVFRIGDFLEVHDKQKRATDVIFSSQIKGVKVRQRQAASKNERRGSSRQFDLGGAAGTLQLASLPGIQAFADRALLGFLKSFAGLHRDQQLQDWQKDFRLGAGVGSFTINVVYGMDAGWAVEGAVGSEYKIDATYLSPHVNMASRMMSACKQYGVKVLLSQAVEELLSKPARSKLRLLDTVYVKGSAVDQRIYTYDARHEGADFFLFERSPEQADIEAEGYSPAVWETDQDLRSMRQHVTDEFMNTFQKGVEQYLAGEWKAAVTTLKTADNLMFEAVLEQGYVDYITEDHGEYGKLTKLAQAEVTRLKNEFGDGACKCLIQYMERRNCEPPEDWHGVRHLMSK